MRARPAGRKIRPVARYRVTAEHALCRGSHRTFALLPRRWWRRWADCSGEPSTGLRPLAERGVRPKVNPARLAHRYRNQSAALVAPPRMVPSREAPMECEQPAQCYPSCPTCRDELLAQSEEQTSELQSLMRISYAVFCLK